MSIDIVDKTDNLDKSDNLGKAYLHSSEFKILSIEKSKLKNISEINIDENSDPVPIPVQFSERDKDKDKDCEINLVEYAEKDANPFQDQDENINQNIQEIQEKRDNNLNQILALDLGFLKQDENKRGDDFSIINIKGLSSRLGSYIGSSSNSQPDYTFNNTIVKVKKLKLKLKI